MSIKRIEKNYYIVLLILYIFFFFFSASYNCIIFFHVYILIKRGTLSPVVVMQPYVTSLNVTELNGMRCAAGEPRFNTVRAARRELFPKKCVIGGIVFEWQRVLTPLATHRPGTHWNVRCGFRAIVRDRRYATVNWRRDTTMRRVERVWIPGRR